MRADVWNSGNKMTKFEEITEVRIEIIECNEYLENMVKQIKKCPLKKKENKI